MCLCERLCLGLAALLHDVGHGPFSHMWEQVVPRSHEDRSCALVQKIFLDHNKETNLNEEEIVFIQSLIHHTYNKKTKEMKERKIKERKGWM